MMKNRYKHSCYNYCVKKSGGYLIYNTLYNTLVRIDEEEYKQYQAIQSCGDDLLRQMVENGLLIEESIDERKRYITYAGLSSEYVKRPASYTVTTTLECNARCQYCYEADIRQGAMEKQNFGKVVDFIAGRDTSAGVQLIWFGGEPLMNTGAIDEITRGLAAENIPFTSYIITNGSLIDEEMVKTKFKLWRVSDIQITLDGTLEEYERRKNYIHKEEGNYYKLLYTIGRIAEKGVQVHIRMNIDEKNIREVCNLAEELEHIFGKYEQVVFYPAFITGMGGCLPEEERVEIIKMIFQRLKNPGKMTVHEKLYSLPKMNPCMMADPNSFSVDIHGNIYPCEHLVGRKEYSIGNIGDQQIEDSRGGAVHLRDECYDCLFLPKCMGGCESNIRAGEDPCMIEKYMIKAYLDLL